MADSKIVYVDFKSRERLTEDQYNKWLTASAIWSKLSTKAKITALRYRLYNMTGSKDEGDED